MPLLFIIDAYNLIFHGAFGKLRKNDLSQSSLALINFIHKYNLLGSRRNQAILVFDGYDRSGMSSQFACQNIQIVFSHPLSADDFIVRTIKKKTGYQCVVVSDDKELMRRARLHHVQTMKIEDFLRKTNLHAYADEEKKLTYLQKQRINKELERLWLK